MLTAEPAAHPRQRVSRWQRILEHGGMSYEADEVASIIGPDLARRTVADAEAIIGAVEALLRTEGHWPS